MMKFEQWYEENKRRFHCGQFTPEEIAAEAWSAALQTIAAKDITLVDGDDWNGIYIDGRLMAEGHSFSDSALLNYCGVEHKILYADINWLSQEGNLPEKLSDVKLDI